MGFLSGVSKAFKKVTKSVTKPITSILGSGSGVSDILNLGGSSLNDLTGVSDTASKSYEYSKRLAEQQQANNIELWKMQNEYNTPAAQIARMANAGIDVNPMTYAVGNGNMSSTAQNISPATYHAPSFSGAGNPISTVLEIMDGVKGLKRRDLENQLLAKDIENYDHNHASPYRDIITALRDIFSSANDWRRPGQDEPTIMNIKGRPTKVYRDRNGRPDIRA